MSRAHSFPEKPGVLSQAPDSCTAQTFSPINVNFPKDKCHWMKIKCHRTRLTVPKHLDESTFKDFITRIQTLYYFDMVFRKMEIKLPRKLKICQYTNKLNLLGRIIVVFSCTELTNVLTD